MSVQVDVCRSGWVVHGVVTDLDRQDLLGQEVAVRVQRHPHFGGGLDSQHDPIGHRQAR